MQNNAIFQLRTVIALVIKMPSIHFDKNYSLLFYENFYLYILPMLAAN